jgi:glutathione S-transferase
MSEADLALRIEAALAAGHMVLFGRLEAFNVQKAVWALEEVGRPYTRIDAGRDFGLTDLPLYRARNPNGRVPLLIDGDFNLWESNVIVRYLCARYGGSLCPADLRARMDVERWMDWQAWDVFTAYRPAYNVISRGRSEFSLAQAEAGLAKTLGLLQILDEHLADRAYVGGDQFTMGDIPLGVQVNEVLQLGRDIRGLENVKAWFGRLHARAAAQPAFAFYAQRRIPSSTGVV